jgi:C-terminal processing protease CtpA/Prc
MFGDTASAADSGPCATRERSRDLLRVIGGDVEKTFRRDDLNALLRVENSESVNATLPRSPQDVPVDRNLGLIILETIKQDLKEFYYDPKFRGIDLEARYKVAQQQIKTATPGQIFGLIGQFLIEFNDSHTSFVPPTLITTVDYGWLMQFFGDKCYVIALNPDSDAAAKGLKLGDEIYAIDGFKPTRQNISELLHSYYVLMPAVRMTVTVKEPNGALRLIEIASAIKRDEKRGESGKQDPAPCHEGTPTLVICKLTTFEVDTKDIDRLMTKVNPYEGFIFDLRGNGGGSSEILLRLLSYFFDREIKIGTSIERKQTRSLTSKLRKDKVFKGRLTVLVDSNSASAAEIFARVIQIEKRGSVIGDRTAGSVMGSILIGHPMRGPEMSDIVWGTAPPSYFVSVTVADHIMSDGERLERVGVNPDLIVVPVAADIAAARDPVLTRAAASFGFEIDPAKAGVLWPGKKETGRRNADRRRPNQ